MGECESLCRTNLVGNGKTYLENRAFGDCREISSEVKLRNVRNVPETSNIRELRCIPSSAFHHSQSSWSFSSSLPITCIYEECTERK